MLILLILMAIITQPGVIIDEYGNTAPVYNPTNRTYEDLPPDAPCDASEAEFTDLQCPPKN